MDEEQLDSDRKDKVVALTKAIAGAIPFIGGAVGEALSLVPGQRMDRIAQYAENLNSRLDAIEEKINHSTPENIDIIERGAHQSCHALSDTRIAYIASLVANAMQAEDVEKTRRARLLKLLDQLDDDELLVLNAYSLSYGGRRNDVWDEIDIPKGIHMGSDRDGMDKSYLYNLGKMRLSDFGLIKAKNFDKKGRPTSYEITPLGRLFMREIGQPSPLDDR